MRLVFALLVASLGACLTEERVVHSHTVPRGQYLARPPSAAEYVTVLLSSSGGATHARVGFSGTCALMQVGENRRVVTQEKRVSVVTLVTTGLLVGGAMLAYALPSDGDTETNMISGTLLLGAAGLTYGIPALMQRSETTELPRRPAERFVQTVDCPMTPAANVSVAIADGRGVRQARTDVRGVALFEGGADATARVFVDDRLVTRVKWQRP